MLRRRRGVLAARPLESAWNHPPQRHGPQACCCDQADSVQGDEEALARVPELHPGVEAAADASGWMRCRAAKWFAPEVASIRAARLFVAELLQAWEVDADLDDAALVVSELATNALCHVGTPFEVVVSSRPGCLRIAVRDASPLVPVAVEATSDDPGGRGLVLVAALTRDWGVDLEGPGKTVWADLATSVDRPRD